MFKTLNKTIVSPANSSLFGLFITIGDVTDIFAMYLPEILLRIFMINKLHTHREF